MSVQSVRQKRDKKNTTLVFSLIILATFLLYAFRLFSMQVIQGDRYKSRSKSISSQSTTIPAQRGEIYDRNNTLPMVINTDSFAVELVPGEIPSGYYDTVASKLANYLGISKDVIDKRVPPNVRRSFSTIKIKTNVPFSVISDIAENINDLPGVSWVSRPMRNYIETNSFSHILGYVGNITQEEMNILYNRGYTKNSIVGKTGIEKQYDALLQGKEGKRTRTVDVRGKTISDSSTVVPPEMGKKLVLTIDARIQTLAEKALGDRVGAIVVLKPSNGEVLAMVSYPNFDSNLFNSDDAAGEYIRLAAGENNPLLNRAINAAYPPASTFKIIMSTAMLAEKAFPEYEKIECPGEIEYGGRVFHCWILKPGHGYLDMKHAIAQSCDVYFWQIGRDYLGVEKIAYYAKLFGYGQSAQIDLPSQSAGFVPTAEWKERRYHERWLGGDTMAISIGQGYTTATPLQVANVMAMVSNEGVVYKPHLLKEVRNPSTDEIIQNVEPEVLIDSKIDPAIFKEVQDGLRLTVTGGSARYSLANKTVQIAAKTGTAEVNNFKNSWHSWLVAYAPFDAPKEDRIVVATIVEAVNKWESWSPFATNIVIQGIFAEQTYDEAVDALGFRFLVKPKGRLE